MLTNVSNNTDKIIIRPISAQFYYSQLKTVFTTSYIGTVIGVVALIFTVPKSTSMTWENEKIFSVCMSIGAFYITSLMGTLLSLSLSEIINSEEEKGYVLNISDETQKQTSQFLKQLKNTSITNNPINFLTRCRNFEGSLNIINDGALSEAQSSFHYYALKDVTNGQDTSRILGRMTGGIIGYTLAFFLKHPLVGTNKGKTFLFVFLSIISGVIVNEQVLTRLFPKCLDMYSNAIGKRYKGRFYNVTIDQIQRFDSDPLESSNVLHRV